MQLVENFDTTGPVRIGIGSEDEAALLYGADVEHIISPSEIGLVLDVRAFRAGDTLVFVRPKALHPSRYLALNEISEGDGLFEVIGHDPMPLKTDDDVRAFLALKAKAGRSAPVREATGRKPEINYSLAQAEAILRFYWHKPNKKPSEVLEFAEKMLDLEPGKLKIHWVKMLARKYTGTTKRQMPPGWNGLGDK